VEFPQKEVNKQMLMKIDPFHGFDRTAVRTWPSGSSFPMDAFRDGNNVEIVIDVPGVDPDAIEVTVEKDVLTVKAGRSTKPDREVETILSERPSGNFTRRVFLGRQLDGERLTATYEHGVLRLAVPVADSAKARRIEIGRPASAAIEETASPEAA
jgi:HSP20 family protein